MPDHTRHPLRRGLPVLCAAAALAACDSSPTGGGGAIPPHDVGIVQNASTAGPNAFSPANKVLSLAAQTTVTWFNGDYAGDAYGGVNGTAHKIASDDGVTFASDNLNPRGTFVATFSAPGTYTYHCAVHPGMTGTVTVNP